MAAVEGVPDRPHDPPDMTRAETLDKAHGRIETRRISRRPREPTGCCTTAWDTIDELNCPGLYGGRRIKHVDYPDDLTLLSLTIVALQLEFAP